MKDGSHDPDHPANRIPIATTVAAFMLGRVPALRIAILFATMSGNAETLAELTAARFSRFGLKVTPANCADVDAAILADLDVAILFASTWGDGQPPIDAREFFQRTISAAAPPLPHLQFAVLALGNKTYPDFCACGRNLDEALARRGATRLLARVDCDQWLRADFEVWLEQVADKIEDLI